MSRRRALVFAALATATLLVSHDVVFLVQLGPGQDLARALRSAGHDYWGAATAAVALLAIAAAIGVAMHLRRLSSRARGVEAVSTPSVALPRRAARTWVLMLTVVAAGFVLQENAEHLVTHAHPIGLGALLGPEYPLALPVITLVTGLAALLVELIAGVERALLERIAASVRRRRPQRRILRPSRNAARTASVLARREASRAPPVVSPA